MSLSSDENSIQRTRNVYRKALRALQINNSEKEERVILLEAWMDFEVICKLLFCLNTVEIHKGFCDASFTSIAFGVYKILKDFSKFRFEIFFLKEFKWFFQLFFN
jgi:hypothetical protein